MSKISDFIRGTKKPKWATAEEWDDWEAKSKTNHPIRHEIVETWIPNMEMILKSPIKLFYNVKFYVKNRFVDKTHALVSHSKHLKRGKWVDLDKRMLYCMFDAFVDFIEIEQANMNFDYFEKNPGVKPGGRNPAAGIEYLYAQIKTDDPSAPQSWNESARNSAQEMLNLYEWWTVTRPSRKPSTVASGYRAYDEKYGKNDGSFSSMFSIDKEGRRLLQLAGEIEDNYVAEDTEMLIRLVKIRGHLWT